MPTPAPEQVRPDLADLVTKSSSSNALCLRNRTTEAARCLTHQDTVPIADSRQGQNLHGAIQHVSQLDMLTWNLNTLHIIFKYIDVFNSYAKCLRMQIAFPACTPLSCPQNFVQTLSGCIDDENL